MLFLIGSLKGGCAASAVVRQRGSSVRVSVGVVALVSGVVDDAQQWDAHCWPFCRTGLAPAFCHRAGEEASSRDLISYQLIAG